MFMTAAVSVLAGDAQEELHAMGQTVIYPIIALCVFAFLALVSLSYRNVANRRPDPKPSPMADHKKIEENPGSHH